MATNIHAVLSEIVSPHKLDLVWGSLREFLGGTGPHRRFPGPNPVSVSRGCLGKRGDWLCSWKADGVRCYLVFFRFSGFPVSVLVTRSNAVFRFSFEGNPSERELLEDGAVFDAELMADSRQLLIFDTLAAGGKSLLATPYRLRHGRMEELLEGLFSSSWTVRFKPVFDLSAALEVWAQRPAECDGLIFTLSAPDQDQDSLGRRWPCILKWKPHHTVDLLMEGTDVTCGNRGKLTTMYVVGGMAVHLEPPEDHGSNHGFIMECKVKLEKERCVFVPVKRRLDIDMPNDITTIESTLETIRDNIDIVTLQAGLAGGMSFRKKRGASAGGEPQQTGRPKRGCVGRRHDTAECTH